MDVLLDSKGVKLGAGQWTSSIAIECIVKVQCCYSVDLTSQVVEKVKALRERSADNYSKDEGISKRYMNSSKFENVDA